MKLISVGYFSRTHGLKGHLLLMASADIDLKKIKAVFIEAEGSQAPYFIEEIKHFSNGLLVKLEGIDTVEAAGKLKNKELLADKKFVFAESDFEFLHFTLIDAEKGEIGEIEEFIDNPGNPLLRVMRIGKEVLLPFNEAFIEKVKKKEKQLMYRAPEGLLDIYL